MAKTPKTPTSSTNAHGKRSRPDTVSEDDDSGVELGPSQPAASTTPTTTTSTKQKPQTKSTRNLRDALETYMMYLDERTARERNSDFLARVQAILKGDRSSEKSERSVNAIKESQNTNRVAMENTYLTAVLPQMIGPSRTVKIPPDLSAHDLSSSSLRMDEILGDSSNPEVLPRMKTVVRSFAEDRLHWEGPCYFVKELITGPRTVKIFGITDPQPDMGFGIRKRGLVFNPPKLSEDARNRIHAAGPLDFCFFIIEDKGPDSPFAHAVTQAIRGGATLVRVMRDLRRRAGYKPSSIGADDETFVFTCAWEHGRADIFVSWQELLPQGEITHMTWLESYALLKDQDIKEFCRDLHNILDWGIDPKRIVKLEQMLSDIKKMEAAGIF
ncbi:MAG: hypothetical protein LQ348_005483 [Seirophora lacunosa]|nr:MAG: hypothetical protein LQ348_005483 [Seirophora lacunosa]